VAGIVEQTGPRASGFAPGDRVCLHYLATCGTCDFCRAEHEQFCPAGRMLGKDRAGGFAEFIAIPARSAFLLPAQIPFEHGAVLMCSSSTALHALHKARLQPGESVAVFGVGGLGCSAIQLAGALGGQPVFAIDIRQSKLDLAEQLGAIPIDGAAGDAATRIRRHTSGRGVDVALELIGLPETMQQAVRSLAPLGRAALAGLTDRTFDVAPYDELLKREAEIIGVSDHLAREVPQLLDFARSGQLDLAAVVTATVPLAAGPINDHLDRLGRFGDEVRTVIVP
jgi:propanol-preferring alcohol dehydrogenase